MTIAVMFFSGYLGFCAAAFPATRRVRTRRKVTRRAGRVLVILVADMISLPHLAKICFPSSPRDVSARLC
jgi:hypothetical protein